MKCISKYLKKLSEEKVFTKEDGEGAAMGGGEVAAPAGDGGDAGDVLQGGDSAPHAPGLVTTDVLGKCDHKKDGCFGPGCFHLPCIWTIPCFRIPRKKKRKKLKFANAVNEDDNFGYFEEDAKSVIQDELDAAQTWLEKLDPELHVSYSPDYEFEDEKSDWVAALDEDSQDDVKSFYVAFNLPMLYQFLMDNGMEMDQDELKAQIRVSLWHEIGHALIDYFRDSDIYDFELSEIDEERLVEDFAKCRIQKYTGAFESKLDKFIRDTFMNGPVEDEGGELKETMGDILTDFKQPIRLSNIHRAISEKDRQLLSKQFVVSGIQIPGASGLFAEQNGKDVVASLNRHGLMALEIDATPQDSDEEEFMNLPPKDQKRFLEIVGNIQKYLDDPKDEFEMDVASEFEDKTEQQRAEILDRYSRLVGRKEILWCRPTLIDVIRICEVGGVNYLPIPLLVALDNHDHAHKKRYIESKEPLEESIYGHDFVDDMYRLQKNKSHFASERWTLLTKDFKRDMDLGRLEYTIRLGKSNGTGINYIFTSGVLFGYDDENKNLQTCYYVQPCEVVYMLRDGEIVSGNENNVNMRFLKTCLDNLIQKKAFAGHSDRLQSYRR